MPRFELVLPEIVMSLHNSPNIKDPIDEFAAKTEKQCSNLNSPEITCSPSPCIFDANATHFKVLSEDRLSPNRENRSPSPDAWNASRRRSPSPFRRSISPVNFGDGSRRGSATTPTGYEMYQKSLLEVPVSMDYGDASSDDLSSEWDSDVPETSHVHNKVSWNLTGSTSVHGRHALNIPILT